MVRRLFPISLLLLLGGCVDTNYLGDEGIFAVAMLADTESFATYEESALFRTELEVPLPLVAPTQDEVRALRMQREGLPWNRAPWVRRHDYEIEIDWVVTNLDDAPRTVTLYANGRNEFQRYLSTATVDLGGLVPGRSQWEQTLRLDAFGEARGSIREDELDEVAVDLATMAVAGTDPIYLIDPAHHSRLDPVSAELVPRLVPALVAVHVGLQHLRPIDSPLDPTTAGVNVLVEFSVRVRDRAGRLAAPDDAWRLPRVSEIVTGTVGG